MAKGAGFEPIAGIAPVRGTVNLLSVARDRTRDQFGAARVAALVPADVRASLAQWQLVGPEAVVAAIDSGVIYDHEAAPLAAVASAWPESDVAQFLARTAAIDSSYPPPPAWASGVSWRTRLTCGTGEVGSEVGPGWRREFCGVGDREDPAAFTQPDFYPYLVYVPIECDWVPQGSVNASELDADARASLEAVTAWNMSRELLTGETEDENPSLANTATDVSGGSPVHPVTALGSLLEAWSNCTQQSGDGRTGPIIHAPLSAVTSLVANNAVRQQGDVLYGPAGSLISPGPGYPTGAAAEPDDGTPQTADLWMYVSGPVEYALGDITVGPSQAGQTRRMNRYQIWGERHVIHRFDPCCVFAIAVYQPSPTDSGGV